MESKMTKGNKDSHQRLVSLKHGDAIYEVLTAYFEDWMDQDDKDEFIEIIGSKISMDEMNDAIETGIKNGYTVGQQIEICKKVLKYILG